MEPLRHSIVLSSLAECFLTCASSSDSVLSVVRIAELLVMHESEDRQASRSSRLERTVRLFFQNFPANAGAPRGEEVTMVCFYEHKTRINVT